MVTFLFLKQVRHYTITLKQKALFTIFKGLSQYNNFHIALDRYQNFWASGLRDGFAFFIKITFVAYHIIFKI